MSVTIYTILDEKSDEIIAYMEGVNNDPDSDWEFIFVDPQDSDLGRFGYRVQTDDKDVRIANVSEDPRALEVVINFVIEEYASG